MLKVGLSGNRYSGKDRMLNLFTQIGVPVFDADVVIKFILNYNYEVLSKIKDSIGEASFKEGKLSLSYIINNKLFDKVIDVIESEVFTAYSNFEKKHSQSVYTIFLSSILFERDWQKKMDYSISVFATKNERLRRATYCSDIDSVKLYKLANTEIDELVKNRLADFIIHNYDSSADSLDDVCDIDKKIIDIYLETLRNEKVKNKVTL